MDVNEPPFFCVKAKVIRYSRCHKKSERDYFISRGGKGESMNILQQTNLSLLINEVG
jgi:hypothetical protein